jgi:hypothetical protein
MKQLYKTMATLKLVELGFKNNVTIYEWNERLILQFFIIDLQDGKCFYIVKWFMQKWPWS